MESDRIVIRDAITYQGKTYNFWISAKDENGRMIDLEQKRPYLEAEIKELAQKTFDALKDQLSDESDLSEVTVTYENSKLKWATEEKKAAEFPSTPKVEELVKQWQGTQNAMVYFVGGYVNPPPPTPKEAWLSKLESVKFEGLSYKDLLRRYQETALQELLKGKKDTEEWKRFLQELTQATEAFRVANEPDFKALMNTLGLPNKEHPAEDLVLGMLRIAYPEVVDNK